MRTMSAHPPPTHWKVVSDAYFGACLAHLQRGGECTELPADRRVWRAVRPQAMQSQLERANWTPDATAALVGNLIDQRPPQRWDWTHIPSGEPLGPYQMWATWDPAATTAWAPFPRWYGADHIRACLGLSDLDRGKPLFLLGYKLPGKWTAWIPTVADAGTFPYFKPNLMGCGCGLTDPWHPRPDIRDQSGAPFQGIPCAEAVHQPICAKDLYRVKHLWN